MSIHDGVGFNYCIHCRHKLPFIEEYGFDFLFHLIRAFPQFFKKPTGFSCYNHYTLRERSSGGYIGITLSVCLSVCPSICADSCPAHNFLWFDIGQIWHMGVSP